jgi:hypothetical protein
MRLIKTSVNTIKKYYIIFFYKVRFGSVNIVYNLNLQKTNKFKLISYIFKFISKHKTIL